MADLSIPSPTGGSTPVSSSSNNAPWHQRPTTHVAFYGALAAIALVGTGFVTLATFKRIPGVEILNRSVLGYGLIGLGGAATFILGGTSGYLYFKHRPDSKQQETTSNIPLNNLIPVPVEPQTFMLESCSVQITYIPYVVGNIDPKTIKAKDPVATIVEVKDTNTIEACKELEGKVAVLNFANAITPGGYWRSFIHHAKEIRRMVSVQEEFLVLNSSRDSLGLALEQIRTQRVGTSKDSEYIPDDGCIYLDDVEYVHADDSTRKVATISCAAVNKFNDARPPSNFEQRMKDKIRVVLYSALEQGVENLVLGAFGCGQYGWEAGAVAEMFKAELESDFKGKFKRVVFAIPGESHPNHQAFKQVFP